MQGVDDQPIGAQRKATIGFPNVRCVENAEGVTIRG